MSESPVAPWKRPELLAALDVPSPWGYLGQNEKGIVPQAVASGAELCQRMHAGEQIDFIWSPHSKHLQTAYQADELADAVIEHDRLSIADGLVATRKPILALIAAVVGGGLWWASGNMHLSFGILILILIGGVHLLEHGPLQAWAFLRRRSLLEADPDSYRSQRDAIIRFRIWQSKHRKTNSTFLCIALGACMIVQSSMDLKTSVMAAGLIKPLLAQGEWWRLLTAGFVHGGLFHIIFNCLALLSLGGLVEGIFGGGRLFWIFLIGCIGSSLMSWWLMPEIPSVGASGGILAFGGFILVCAWLRPELKQAGLAHMPIRWAVILAAIGLVGAGFIDNAGHLGGWLTGMALAPLMAPRTADDYPSAGDQFLKLPGAVAVIAVAAWTCWLLKEAA